MIKYRFQKGLTIIELMVAIGILLVLFALTTINISRLPSSAAQSSGYDLLISDIRSQQNMSMTRGLSYGVEFEGTSYILFTGTSFNPADSNNFIVNLDPNLSFTGSSFPTNANGSYVVFSVGTGDFANYISGHDSISITNNATGEVKQVRINKYGATY